MAFTSKENIIYPVVALPRILLPNELLSYTEIMFPVQYKNGAFVEFHGSWSHSPEKQEGFHAALVPFPNGKLSGRMGDIC